MVVDFMPEKTVNRIEVATFHMFFKDAISHFGSSSALSMIELLLLKIEWGLEEKEMNIDMEI